MNVLPSEWIHEDWNNDRTYDGASEVNSGQGVNLGRRRLEIALRDGLNARRVVIVRVVPDVTEATRFRAVVDAAREEEGLGRNRHVRLGLASDSKRCRIGKKVSRQHLQFCLFTHTTKWCLLHLIGYLKTPPRRSF